jgi:hypothetical protein
MDAISNLDLFATPETVQLLNVVSLAEPVVPALV